MRPIHCSTKEEENYYWKIFIDQVGNEKVKQVLLFCVKYLENLTNQDMKMTSYNDVIKNKSLVKGLHITKVIPQYLNPEIHEESTKIMNEFIKRTEKINLRHIKVSSQFNNTQSKIIFSYSRKLQSQKVMIR